MSWSYIEFNKWIDSGCDESKAKKVYTLNLNSHKLTSLPESFGRLVNLRILYLYGNKLTSLPESFGQLRNLQTLKLGNNRLTSLPECVCQLENLQTLDLCDNQLARLPKSFGQLINLQTLYLYGNQLRSLPKSFSQLTNLQVLCLSENKLTTLPKCIEQLVNLITLNLGENKLRSLPKSFGQLVNLHTLSLHYNQLINIPKSFGQLVNLNTLYLGNNQLINIPEALGQLVNLNEFSIYANQLTSLPPFLGNLLHLERFNYSNNPIEHIPANVLRMINRTETVQGVYTDAQSVHNSSIQKSLLDSVNRLLAIPIPTGGKEVINSILTDSFLTEDTKARLIEYSEDTSVHTVLNLTFSEMLVVVWNRIETLSKQRDEIKKTLNSEMQDAECKCFTGRISRLVNCLAGYDDLVVVEIADSEQIGTIVELVRSRLEENYTVEEHRRLVSEELTERGYSREVIDEWVKYIE